MRKKMLVKTDGVLLMDNLEIRLIVVYKTQNEEKKQQYNTENYKDKQYWIHQTNSRSNVSSGDVTTIIF
jgi:hypothetical protein